MLHYDDSLPAMLDVLAGHVGLVNAVVLRDASGQLALFLDEDLDESRKQHLTKLLQDRLGAYARPDRVIAGRDDPGAARVLADPAARPLTVGATTVRYLDRRIVGADWLFRPSATEAKPPRFVFASLKGGVGRSTALSVVAADQAKRGRNVLVVDLDLEAPGVGSMLLTTDRRPTFGALDYLVERNLGPVSNLASFVGTGGLTAGAGLVDVVPVVGTRAHASPENFLAKLSRAMLEEVVDGKESVSVAGKVRAMLDDLEARQRYDLVLVDSRAGLAELAAGPLLGLGATVLLFGTAQTQTTDALAFLFSHLASLVEAGDPSPWRRLKMVHAKALDSVSRGRFKDDLLDLFAKYLYEEQDGLDEGFNFGPDEPEAPHNPIVVPLEPAFADWDPAKEPNKLVDELTVRTFDTLLRFVEDAIRRAQP